jgi:hypothetical protein
MRPQVRIGYGRFLREVPGGVRANGPLALHQTHRLPLGIQELRSEPAILVGGSVVLNGNPGPDGGARGGNPGRGQEGAPISDVDLVCGDQPNVPINPIPFVPPALPVPAINPEGE